MLDGLIEKIITALMLPVWVLVALVGLSTLVSFTTLVLVAHQRLDQIGVVRMVVPLVLIGGGGLLLFGFFTATDAATLQWTLRDYWFRLDGWTRSNPALGLFTLALAPLLLWPNGR